MKKFTLSFVSLALAVLATACGSSPSAEKATSTVAWSNTGMQAIVSGSCAVSGCHNGTQAPNYSGISEAAMRMVEYLFHAHSGRATRTPLAARSISVR